jgi:hypothetical protein
MARRSPTLCLSSPEATPDPRPLSSDFSLSIDLFKGSGLIAFSTRNLHNPVTQCTDSKRKCSRPSHISFEIPDIPCVYRCSHSTANSCSYSPILISILFKFLPYAHEALRVYYAGQYEGFWWGVLQYLQDMYCFSTCDLAREYD